LQIRAFVLSSELHSCLRNQRLAGEFPERGNSEFRNLKQAIIPAKQGIVAANLAPTLFSSRSGLSMKSTSMELMSALTGTTYSASPLHSPLSKPKKIGFFYQVLWDTMGAGAAVLPRHLLRHLRGSQIFFAGRAWSGARNIITRED
jgi:hypothetical protein